MRTPDDFLTRFSIRTMDEIQRHIIKRDKRNAISRHYHAKDDEKAIDTWKLDLGRILPVFNVCPIAPARRLLTLRFQIELGVNSRATVSDAHQDTANKQTIVPNIPNIQGDTSNAKVVVPNDRRGDSNVKTIVSGVRSDVANTSTIVSDTHRDKLKSREGADGRNQPVGITRTLPITE